MDSQFFNSKNAKNSLYAAYLLRIYLTLNSMGFSVSLPVIANRYGALEWYAVILVTGSTASTIISSFSGSFSLMIGRRKALVVSTIGTVVFSLFCAFSLSLPMFIIGYFLLNLFTGVANTMPVGVLIDSTDPVERPRFMSLYSVMNNTGTLLGPLLGGFVTDTLGFRFTPIYPLPLAVVSLVILLRSYKQSPGAIVKSKAFDVAGGTLLIGGVGSLIVLLNTAGDELKWTSPLLWGLGLMFLLCLTLFLHQEKRSSNPIIPLEIFRIPSFAIANILIPLIIPQMILSNSFTLLLVQSGMGYSATFSATYFVPKTLAIIVISLLLGRWISHNRTYHKKFVLVSGGLIGLVEFLLGLTSRLSCFPILLYVFNFFLGAGESMYYMTLYSLYQRDLSPILMPTGISAQFLLAMLSCSLASTTYGIILSVFDNDILQAYPVMCFFTLIPTVMYVVIAAGCLHSPESNKEPMIVTLPGRRQKHSQLKTDRS